MTRRPRQTRQRRPFVTARAAGRGRVLLVIWGLALVGPPRPAASAPRPEYGGVSRAFVLEPTLEIDPRRLESTSELAISGLVYETLYALEPSGALRPVLARAAPELRGATLWVPLRDDVVFHDGRAMTPASVRDHFLDLASRDSAAAFVMAPVRGAGAREAGESGAEVGVTSDDHDGSVRFELIAPSPDFARRLAAPESAVIARDEGSAAGHRPVGTGPFFVAARPATASASSSSVVAARPAPASASSSSVVAARPAPASASSSGVVTARAATSSSEGRGDDVYLAAFSRHRDGRPYLDAIDVQLGGPRRGRGPSPRGAIILGVGGSRDIAKAPPIARPPGAPVDLLVLTFGDGAAALSTPRARRAIDRAMDRATLARRFLSGEAEPARALVVPTAESDDGATILASDRPLRATLIVSSRDPEVRRIADRIQLDLLRAGVTVVIEPLSSTAFELRRRDRRYDLMLARAYVPRVGALDTPSAAFDVLHALLALGQAFAVRAPLTTAELTDALRTPDEARRAGLVLERRLRLDHGILPLATRAPELRVEGALRGARVSPLGTLELADAALERLDPPRSEIGGRR